VGTQFKWTDAGRLPSDWEARKLSTVSRIVRGGSPRPAGDPRFFNGSFIPWLTVAALTNLPDWVLEVRETFGWLTEAGSKRSRKLEAGTLIIANSGATLGIAKILGVTCCANDGIAALLHVREVQKHFLCYYLNGQTKRLREVVASGNGQPNLNTDLIGEIAVPFPEFEEQQTIASALRDIDGLLVGLAWPIHAP